MTENSPSQQGSFLPVFILILLFFIWGVVNQKDSFSTTYFALGIVTLLLFLLSLAVPSLFDFKVLSMSKSIIFEVIVGLVAGFILTSKYFTGQAFGLFSLSAPPILSVAGGIGAIGTIFISSCFVGIIEEAIFRGSLLFSFAKWGKFPSVITGVWYLFAGFVYFILGQQLLGIILAVGILALHLSGYMGKIVTNYWFLIISGVIVLSSIFAIYHGYAYQWDENLMINAFAVGVMFSVLTLLFQSCTASIIAHTVNNAVVMGVLAGYSAFFGLFVGLFMCGLFIILARPGQSFKVVGAIAGAK